MLELGLGERVVLDPEVGRVGHAAAEVGHERVVGVEDEHAAAGAGGGDGGPAVGDRLELAVAVELVAEQVAEQQRARVELLDDGAQPELVDLEEPELARQLAAAAAGGAGQRGRHAARHVRPGAVVDQPRAPALEDRGEHRGGRRLAVRGRHDDAAALQARREQADRVRLEAGEQLAGQRCPAAAAGAAGERADRLRRGELGGQERHGASTFSAPAATLTVAGRSAIGSPSA